MGEVKMIASFSMVFGMVALVVGFSIALGFDRENLTTAQRTVIFCVALFLAVLGTAAISNSAYRYGQTNIESAENLPATNLERGIDSIYEVQHSMPYRLRFSIARRLDQFLVSFRQTFPNSETYDQVLVFKKIPPDRFVPKRVNGKTVFYSADDEFLASLAKPKVETKN